MRLKTVINRKGFAKKFLRFIEIRIAIVKDKTAKNLEYFCIINYEQCFVRIVNNFSLIEINNTVEKGHLSSFSSFLMTFN